MLRPVREEEIEELAAYAEDLWHSAYDGLIGKAQVDYMTGTIQSAGNIRRQVREDRYAYFFLERGGERIGYCGLQDEGGRLFLSKLYLEERVRGRGIGGEALAEILETAREEGKRSVYLTVNKGNARAVRAYEKAGFIRIRSEVTDIGGGFVMDDYVYEYVLRAGEDIRPGMLC